VTIDELTKIASALGIKLKGTQMYQAWAARVVEADKFDQDILSASNTLQPVRGRVTVEARDDASDHGHRLCRQARGVIAYLLRSHPAMMTHAERPVGRFPITRPGIASEP
jgi:hypothetical protein